MNKIDLIIYYLKWDLSLMDEYDFKVEYFIIVLIFIFLDFKVMLFVS